MNKICYICNSSMIKKITSINTGWGQYKLVVEGVSAYVCPKCNEIILEGNDSIMLQNLSKSLADAKSDNKPDILNLSEVADLLRVTNQTVYNMIKDGRLKASKIGREWRFLKNDIAAIMYQEESLDMVVKEDSNDSY